MNAAEKLLEEIGAALEQIEDIGLRIEDFLSRSMRDFESALLLSRYLSNATFPDITIVLIAMIGNDWILLPRLTATQYPVSEEIFMNSLNS